MRFLLKGLAALFLSVCLLACVAVIASQVQQHIFRHKAERLLSEIHSLELRKTSWGDAQSKFQGWSTNRKYIGACNERECSFEITINDAVFGFVSSYNIFVRADDYIRWRLRLSYDMGPFARTEQSLFHAYMRFGGHPAKIVANVGMRDGIVWSKGISVVIETYTHNIPDATGGVWYEYSLMAGVHSVSRFRYQAHGIDPQLATHPDYMMGHPGGCEGCVLGWAQFTPYAAPADVHRLLKLDFSCLTRWHACEMQADIMPDAWMQYLAERHTLDAVFDQSMCSPSMLEVLGRDSANIGTGEIIGFEDTVGYQGYHQYKATVRLVSRLKGLADWSVGEVRSVPLVIGHSKAKVRLSNGSRWVFFGSWDHEPEMQIDSGPGCPSVSAAEANLSLVRRGVDKDFGRATPID